MVIVWNELYVPRLNLKGNHDSYLAHYHNESLAKQRKENREADQRALGQMVGEFLVGPSKAHEHREGNDEEEVDVEVLEVSEVRTDDIEV